MSEYRALLVDDEEEFVNTLVERLEYRGYQAEYATTGQGALKMLREKPFDVVVVDLKLPGMSGEDLIHTIAVAYPNLPLLLVTGHAPDGSGAAEKPAEAYDLLLKPINIDDLVTKMTEAILSHEPEKQ